MSFYSLTDYGKYTTIYSPDELTTIVNDNLNWYKEQADIWEKRTMDLKADAEAVVRREYEEKIQQLEERLRLSYGEFASQKEKEAYEQFEKEHMHDRLSSKYNGGRAPYLIPTGTGVGTSLTVKCPICGESKNITDTGVW